MNEIVAYLAVISPRINLNEEDDSGMNALTYYLAREDFEMCNKLIFRGADVNHIFLKNSG